MANLIQRGMSMLGRVLGDESHGFGTPITYTRGGVGFATSAWVGRTVFRQVEAGQAGAAILWGERDYELPIANFPPALDPPYPLRGDRVTETIDGTPVTFELHAPGQEPVYRYSDPTRTIFRLHVKRVGAA